MTRLGIKPTTSQSQSGCSTNWATVPITFTGVQDFDQGSVLASYIQHAIRLINRHAVWQDVTAEMGQYSTVQNSTAYIKHVAPFDTYIHLIQSYQVWCVRELNAPIWRAAKSRSRHTCISTQLHNIYWHNGNQFGFLAIIPYCWAPSERASGTIIKTSSGIIWQNKIWQETEPPTSLTLPIKPLYQ